MRFGPVVALGVLGFLSVAAKADTVQPVGGSGGGFSGEGTLIAKNKGNGKYKITEITGTGVGDLIDKNGFEGNDNFLFPGASPVLDSSGFSFTDTEGDTDFDVNLYAANGSYAANVQDLDPGGRLLQDLPITFSLGTAPPSPRLETAYLKLVSQTSTTTVFDFSYGLAAPTGTPPTSVTPEPASFALLGTGFLGLAGAVRRRRRS